MFAPACHSLLNISAAHARASCSLTFAPWMKKTFAFSARAANGSKTAANAKSVAAMGIVASFQILCYFLFSHMNKQ